MAADELQHAAGVPLRSALERRELGGLHAAQYRFIYWAGGGCLFTSLILLILFRFIPAPKPDFARYQAIYPFACGGLLLWAIGFRCALHALGVLREPSGWRVVPFQPLVWIFVLSVAGGVILLVDLVLDALAGR
jgi:hypothetical protein